MASIHKRSRDKGKKNRPYTIYYYDHEGKRRSAKGFTDKALTEQLAAKLENEVLLRRRGMIDPAQERLLSIKQSPIEEHLESFDRSLANNTPKHRRLTMTRVRRVVEGCGFGTLAEMDGEKVVEWLNEFREEEDLGARTYNHYLQAADAFGKWLAATKRLPGNPLVGMERLNAETDVRHKRRALTPEEFARLVEAARTSGVEVQGYDGEMRARIYQISYLTGLRRSELASLTLTSFRLDDPQPTVTVEAACSKHRRKDTLPMHPEMVALVREWIVGLAPDEPLFEKLARRKTYTMVQKDLERAGIPYETHDGLADFHAAGRHSHVTGLVKSGATLVEAKELARHADVRQTMKYTHIGLEDQAQALAGLPAPFASAASDGLRIGCAPGGVLGQGMSPGVSGDVSSDGPSNEQAPAGPGLASLVVANCHQLTVCGEMEAAGIAPASRDASVRASTCVADRLIVGLGAPIGRVPDGLSRHEFNSSRNRQLSSSDPELASPAGSLGQRSSARPWLLFRQRDGDQHCCWQVMVWSAFYEAC
jgi:site-specific recombinase XerD